jgi:hypothetical protein
VSNSSGLGFHLVHGTAGHQECRREGGRGAARIADLLCYFEMFGEGDLGTLIK